MLKFIHQITLLIFISISSVLAASGGGSSGGSSGGMGSSGDGDGMILGSNYNSELSEIIINVKNEEFKIALDSLENFVYENPNDVNGWNYIGFVSRKLKKYEDAERYYAAGLEINPNHVGILEYQGELYLETNRLELAKENLVKLSELCIFNCTEKKELANLIEMYEDN